jgi:hypothetical protein
MKNLNKLSGALLLFSVITVFIALIITLQFDIALNPSQLNSEVMGKTLQNVATFSKAHITELIFDELSDFAIVVLAALLYLGFRKYNRAGALAGSVCFLAGGIIMAAHNMGNFALTGIANDYVVSTGAQAATLEIAASAVVLTAKSGVPIGSSFIVLGVLLYGIVVTQVSRFIGWFGIIGSILAFIAIPLGWIGPQLEMITYGLYFPMMIWEILFGIWLISTKRLVKAD